MILEVVFSGTLNFSGVLDDYEALMRELIRELTDRGVQEGRFPAAGGTGRQNIAMIADRCTQNVFLLWCHDAGIDVLLKREYPACPFTYGEDGARHDWGYLAGEARSVERQLAFNRGFGPCEDRMVKSRNRAHGGLRVSRAHCPDRAQRFP